MTRMSTTQIHADRVGDVLVSTVLIEPFGYYETAIVRRSQPVELVESNIADAGAAAELHRATVEQLTP